MNDEFKQPIKPMSTQGADLLNKIKQSSIEIDDISAKEFKIRKYRANSQSRAIDESEELLESARNIRLDIIDPNYFNNMASENLDYFKYAKNCADFINIDFRDTVPFFARNLIFIGAESGQGKSTIAGNLAYHTITQEKNVLILTNEEIDSDVYNRVTCLCRKWPYTNHRNFSDDQISEFNRMLPILGQRLTVVSDRFNGKSGATTTFEGIRSVLESLLVTNKQYDVIIIDYFQNISTSLEDRTSPEWKVLDKLAQYLDNFRKLYNAPIVVLGQLKPSNSDEPAHFKERIERCKAIYNKATCCLEVKADRENSRTEFICHKSRFNESVNKIIYAGFKKGMYVQFDSAFKNETLLKKQAKDDRDFLEKTMKGRISE